MRIVQFLLVLLGARRLRRQSGHRQEGNPVRLRSAGAEDRRAELRADAAEPRAATSTCCRSSTAYVNEVGQKLAAVADRKLPYEFVVLNNSVPNAWALPGGKIAVNRGLLTELKNEAELAAVLGHEIVHAAARHGAKAQERGTLLQVGLAAAQIGAAVSGVDTNVAGLLIQGAGVGAQLDPAEVRPRTGARERPVRHEVHEARRLRSVRAP